MEINNINNQTQTSEVAKKEDTTEEKTGQNDQKLDPVTGMQISLTAYNNKYNDGNTTIYVRDPNTNQIEAMTADEYIERYGEMDEPPKAELTNPENNKNTMSSTEFVNKLEEKSREE